MRVEHAGGTDTIGVDQVSVFMCTAIEEAVPLSLW